MSDTELEIVREKANSGKIKEAICRLQGEDLLEFVLVTTQSEKRDSESISVLRSDLRVDTLVGMLHQAIHHTISGSVNIDYQDLDGGSND